MYAREDSFTVYLPSGKVYRIIDQGNAANGYYYGLSVDDILSTPEGRRWFPPEEILKADGDGFVWVDGGASKCFPSNLSLPSLGRPRGRPSPYPNNTRQTQHFVV